MRRAAKWCAATLLAAGIALGGVLGWEIWGTALETARHQRELADQFAAGMPDDPVPVVDDEVPAVPARVTSGPGEMVGRIVARSIGLDAYVVHGTRYRDLVRGPGWVPGTAYPGGPGNAAISGHRTSYGAPFADINLLAIGDDIEVTVDGRTHVYVVTGSVIVRPDRVDVMRTTDWTRSTLTLISCHPKYSSKKRIVVTAEQRAATAPGASGSAPPASGAAPELADAADFGTSPYETARSLLETAIWIAATALIVLLIGVRMTGGRTDPPTPGTDILDIFVLESPIAPAPSPTEAGHH